MQTIGIVGLGLMGSALSERFLGAGYRVVGYDLRSESREHLRSIGGEFVHSVLEVLSQTSIILLSLPNSDVVESVINEVSDMLSGKTIIDTTTGEPEATTKLGKRLYDRGVDYLDATLTGSSQVARSGELIVTAGGREEVFRRCEELFHVFAKQWFHVGSWGSGSRTKLVVNLVLGLNRAVLAEGLNFAKACGLNLPAMLEILRSGAAYSKVMDSKGRKMIEQDFATEAKLAQHWKDVRLILDLGRQVHARLPFSELHEQLLSNLAQLGLGDADNSCIIRAFTEGPEKS